MIINEFTITIPKVSKQKNSINKLIEFFYSINQPKL